MGRIAWFSCNVLSALPYISTISSMRNICTDRALRSVIETLSMRTEILLVNWLLAERKDQVWKRGGNLVTLDTETLAYRILAERIGQAAFLIKWNMRGHLGKSRKQRWRNSNKNCQQLQMLEAESNWIQPRSYLDQESISVVTHSPFQCNYK